MTENTSPYNTDDLNFDADATNQPSAEETSASEEQFFPAESLGLELPDPSTVVILRTSTGAERVVPITEPTTLSEILITSGLSIQGQAQYWLNGANIPLSTPVAPGSTVTIVGSVKGG